MQPQLIATGAFGILMIVEVIWMCRNTLRMSRFAQNPVDTGECGTFYYPKWDIFMRCQGTKGEITHHVPAVRLMYKTRWLFKLSILTGITFVGCGIWTAASFAG